MSRISKPYRRTVDVVRKTPDTRSTVTTIYDDIVMDIQPTGGGARMGDMRLLSQNLYHAFPTTLLANVKQGDIVRETGKNDLYVVRKDEMGTHQELILSESQGVL